MASVRGRWAALGILGAWALAVPYVAAAAGLELDLAPKLEVIDHVVPGAVILGASAIVLALRRQDPAAHEVPVIGTVAIAMLAALWITTSHIPLLGEAAQGSAPLAASLLHGAAGPPVLLLSLWLLAGEYRASGARA
ncbi:MAG: DUF6529 family protein [Solirubrobacteraceae bacterium]